MCIQSYRLLQKNFLLLDLLLLTYGRTETFPRQIDQIDRLTIKSRFMGISTNIIMTPMLLMVKLQLWSIVELVITGDPLPLSRLYTLPSPVRAGWEHLWKWGRGQRTHLGFEKFHRNDEEEASYAMVWFCMVHNYKL